MTETWCDLTLKTESDWHRLVESRPWKGRDIYFLPSWYRTWEESGHGEAHCLYSRTGETEFLYPFLYTPIDGYDLPEQFYDVQTAYGYGGVLMAGPSSDHAVHAFNALVDEWMQDHKVVAEFIRLLPDLNLKKIRKSTYVPVRKDIFLDLAGFTEESIWEKLLSSKSRNMIRKSQKENLQIFLEKDLEASFNDFVKIYQEFAQRIEMDPFYLFSDAYFRSFQIHMQDFVLLAHAKKDGKICASSVWLCYHDMIHYYLGTTDKACMHLPCSDAYIWGVIRSMLESGAAKVIHFGGGMSMDPDDTLFRFKAKYANRSEVVYISKRVHNDSIYRMLCDQWAQKYPHLVPKHGQKLLRYRERNNA